MYRTRKQDRLRGCGGGSAPRSPQERGCGRMSAATSSGISREPGGGGVACGLQ
ncbi:Hypothetical protein CAP_4191 [Chondromyces apiculatus DSM 436]|uniref:Uncharacterized protein n=1 Tax=Chondromyces apiculatus DSM 436 TaxID=1192034 RepID=A0A017T7Z5_9BACT|nr:Hypothetical protein CAP_4191 [Chondromyces apiculatus DSM 436]